MLTNYNKQHKFLLAVDCVIFGYEKGELKLLLFKRQIEPAKGQWSLVGGWVQPNESTKVAANRVLQAISGLKNIYMEEVGAYSEPNRDPGGRVISVVYYALLPLDRYDRNLLDNYSAQWISIANLPELIFDHSEMVENALAKLRNKASYELIGKQLLPEKFTLLQLRNLYNAIYQLAFDPGNFRKRMLSTNLLQRLDEKDMSESKKGAYYYRYKNSAELGNTDEIEI